ncbi:TPA: ABC-three component system middle component 6 [Serratia marcescens]
MINNVQYPDKSLYIIGSKIINVFHDGIHKSMSAVRLHDNYERLYEKVSYPYFIYALDWLFIIDAIRLNGNGDLELCS